jgi:DNA-binding transcriptional ArsR family regulator
MTNEIPLPTTREQRVLDGGALRALAHPLRVEIYDLISQYGPQTASTLAAMTGESSGATSYHLRALAKHDLIREVEGQGTARERWWERPRGGVQIGSPEAVKTPAGRAATQVVLTEFLNRRHQQLMDYVGASLRENGVWDDSAMITTATIHLTAAQAADVVAQLQAVIDGAVERYKDQRGEGVVPVTVHADVFALPEKGR